VDSPHGQHGDTGSIECVDDNLDLLARGLGGSVHAVKFDDHCVVIHRFNTSETFDIYTRPGFPMQILVVGGGGGAGGGSGWEDSSKAPGAEPESGAGAGGAGGNVLSADVWVDSATGAFTYTPTEPGNIDGSYIYTPTAIPAGTSFSDPAGRTLATEITVGLGGAGGTAGTSTAGSTAGGQGGAGGESAFGTFKAGGGGGGFGGRGAEGSEPGVQSVNAWRNTRSGGQDGGSNAAHVGFNLGSAPTIEHAAPGGAGAAEDGHGPTPVGTTGNGGNGGAGVTPRNFFASSAPTFGSGGGGGTISPASPPFAAVTGGTGGPEGFGGRGGAGGNGEDALNGFGGGGGGGGTDGSVTVGDSNAGIGGKGGDGVVFVRYLALAVPNTPEAPTAVAGDSSATLTITPLADTPDHYVVWVVGEPAKQCTVTPPETFCVIEGLTNGEDYVFETYAWNQAGESDSSADSLTITPSTDAGTLPYTGNNTSSLASLALIMIGLGGAVTAFARRRRTIA
jgi:LPXTG-motif cell wall-anchored protein